MTVHVETVGLQKNSVRWALKYVLPHIDKDRRFIELSLVPALKCLTDDNMDARLKQVANKHSQISGNIKTHAWHRFNNIDNPTTPGSEINLWKLIMDIRAEDGERFAITMTHNWKNVIELWVKKKHKHMQV